MGLKAILTKRMDPQGNNDHPVIYVLGLEAKWIPHGIYKDELGIKYSASKCTGLKVYTGHSSYYYYLYYSKGPHRVYVS